MFNHKEQELQNMNDLTWTWVCECETEVKDSVRSLFKVTSETV